MFYLFVFSLFKNRCIVTPIPTAVKIAITEILEWNMAIATPKESHKVNKILFNWHKGIPLLEKYECT